MYGILIAVLIIIIYWVLAYRFRSAPERLQKIFIKKFQTDNMNITAPISYSLIQLTNNKTQLAGEVSIGIPDHPLSVEEELAGLKNPNGPKTIFVVYDLNCDGLNCVDY